MPHALAQVVEVKSPADPNYFPRVANPSVGAGESIASLITFGIGVAGILAVIAITWAGIQMFLSIGDEAKYNKAKELMIYALVGVGLAGLAYLIVRIVSGLSFTS